MEKTDIRDGTGFGDADVETRRFKTPASAVGDRIVRKPPCEMGNQTGLIIFVLE